MDSFINKNHLNSFSLRLKLILDDELANGNAIAETHKGWPTGQTIVIFLKKPFYKKHTVEGAEYFELNDPHYWKAEYADRTLGHILACRF